MADAVLPTVTTLPTVTAEIIEPQVLPDRYGMRRLAEEISAIDPTAMTVNFADISAVRNRIGKFWHRSPPYQVLDDGADVIQVPILVVAAPDVPSILVGGTLSAQTASGGSFSFTVAGNGPTADVKLTVGSTTSIGAGPGESLRVVIDVPVRWEKRAPRDQTDHGVWVAVWPAATAGPQVTRVEHAAVDNPVTALTEIIDASMITSQPVQRTHSFAAQASLGFSLGFTAAGIDASLGVTADFSTAYELTASMPTGHQYELNWLGGPMGVWVKERDHQPNGS
ncbi:MAG: hypothetical protein M3Y77_17200 [Actinomycetota bacterium]|nr:hypothetical protein [Actinomycetota bacterium]MDQ2848042.1 hypothetical protein [Actinomycetota bacterium]MDQ2957620.1 hypothetical protein [Actinomycetota bacterium]